MRFQLAIGWLTGILVAAVAAGVGELVAVFFRPISSPVLAVGNRVITLTPESLKRQAISSSGTDDKPLLITGILLLLALLGALVGELATRDIRVGLVGVGLVGAFGCYCAVTQPTGRASDLVPTLIGTLVAAVAMVGLTRVAKPHVRTSEAGELIAVAPDRRLFLQGSVAAAALAAVTGLGGRAAQHAKFGVEQERDAVKLPAAPTGTTVSTLPAGVDLGKSGVPWRTPNDDFYRIDRALTIPQLDPKTWVLNIHGMVDKPMKLTYQDLLERPLINRWITLNCVSNEVGGNLVSNSLFRGTLLADVLREAGVQSGADQLLCSGADGMTIGAPVKTVMDGRDALLAVGMNGQPLPLAHGFPVRVVVPGLYGYISACKWVTDIEVTTFDQRRGYWVEGGWAVDPPLQIASRIDRPSSGETASVGEVYAVAGVAWDQHVGIDKVEVQIDDEPWQTARLARVPESDTWRQWVYPWTPEKSGEHRIRVRAVNAAGDVQTSERHDVFPSGATGLHSVTVHAFV